MRSSNKTGQTKRVKRKNGPDCQSNQARRLHSAINRDSQAVAKDRLCVGLFRGRSGSFFSGGSRSGFCRRSWCRTFCSVIAFVCRSRTTACGSGLTAGRGGSAANRSGLAANGSAAVVIVVVTTIIIVVINAAAAAAAVAEEEEASFRFLRLCAETSNHQHHPGQCKQTKKLSTHRTSPQGDIVKGTKTAISS